MKLKNLENIIILHRIFYFTQNGEGKMELDIEELSKKIKEVLSNADFWA